MPLRPPSLWGSRQPGIGYRHNWAHPLARGLVAHYLCNEGAGTRIYDVVRKNHGTLTGSIAWAKARGGRSLAPASLGYGAQIAADVFAFGRSAFTVCGWFALSDVSTFSILMSLGGSNTVGGVISAGPPNGLAYYANAQRITGSTALAVAKDYFFAFIGDGGADGARALRLFLNGVQEGAPYMANYNFSATAWAIGANQSSVSEILHGLIRDVRIYNRAISVAEMRQLVASPYADMEPPRGRYRYSRERTQLTAGFAGAGSAALGAALAAGAAALANGHGYSQLSSRGLSDIAAAANSAIQIGLIAASAGAIHLAAMATATGNIQFGPLSSAIAAVGVASRGVSAVAAIGEIRPAVAIQTLTSATVCPIAEARPLVVALAHAGLLVHWSRPLLPSQTARLSSGASCLSDLVQHVAQRDGVHSQAHDLSHLTSGAHHV